MKTFSELFRRYRLKVEFEKLTDLADAFAQKGYAYEASIFSHWQKGKRIPNKRIILLTLIALFLERGAIRLLSEANEFLESAGHGYLTEREQSALFKKESINLQ